ncbi:hypothetical protein [Neogemmobacter tilapiae]|uniref:DUF2125 domain-containing protein n=1 Tax=Neogemmobacter tilapiae TaxID=875041 RepID=A0A918TQE2_9RHOB|nr:hypothetical protein [Gemmobacter tilapiae]GHC57592.1 hypothetical protein GCM10007315_21300 [Gemmobacter tilapiae]
MKGTAVRLLGILGVLLMAGTAEAEGWRNWYVGRGDGNHLLTVETEAEASEIRAGVESKDDFGDRITFGVRCHLGGPRADNILSDEGIISATFIGGTHRNVKVPIRLSGSFDGASEVDLGVFMFNQFALVGNAPPQLLAMLTTHEELTITSDNGTFSATVPLENAGAAMAGIKCWGEM